MSPCSFNEVAIGLLKLTISMPLAIAKSARIHLSRRTEIFAMAVKLTVFETSTVQITTSQVELPTTVHLVSSKFPSIGVTGSVVPMANARLNAFNPFTVVYRLIGTDLYPGAMELVVSEITRVLLFLNNQSSIPSSHVIFPFPIVHKCLVLRCERAISMS
jgi:hypothetical protein